MSRDLKEWRERIFRAEGTEDPEALRCLVCSRWMGACKSWTKQGPGLGKTRRVHIKVRARASPGNCLGGGRGVKGREFMSGA